MRTIKKYPNRRLYDTAIGAYVTLDAIKQLVLDHENFQVIDAKTQKDLTQNTLLQIIAEQELTSDALFTIPMLQQFIRLSHEKSHAAFTDYLEKTLKIFAEQKDIFQQQWEMYQKTVFNPGVIWGSKQETTSADKKPGHSNKNKKNT